MVVTRWLKLLQISIFSLTGYRGCSPFSPGLVLKTRCTRLGDKAPRKITIRNLESTLEAYLSRHHHKLFGFRIAGPIITKPLSTLSSSPTLGKCAHH